MTPRATGKEVSTPKAPIKRARRSKPLSDAALRALAEAEARRLAAAQGEAPQTAQELGGRQGPEPTRYGDWENKGIASDF